MIVEKYFIVSLNILIQFENNDQCKNYIIASTSICCQFEKALSKVGITKYHHLTGEEVRNTQDIVAMLRWVNRDVVVSSSHNHQHKLTGRDILSQQGVTSVTSSSEDIDTVISDVHGHDLDLLIDKLSGKEESLMAITYLSNGHTNIYKQYLTTH